jgi:hypothetical protein
MNNCAIFNNLLTIERQRMSFLIDTEKEERIARNTYAGLEVLLMAMRQASFFGRKEEVRNLHAALKSTLETVNDYMERHSDKFEEAHYDLLGEDLSYIEKQADGIFEAFNERVAG